MISEIMEEGKEILDVRTIIHNINNFGLQIFSLVLSGTICTVTYFLLTIVYFIKSWILTSGSDLEKEKRKVG